MSHGNDSKRRFEMRSAMVRRLWSVCLATVLLMTLAVPLAAQQDADQEKLYRLVNKIRKKIVTLNNYGVFDYITFGLKGGTSGVIVVLQGYASRPQLMKSADRVVSKIENVEMVENNIEVLPMARMDEDTPAQQKNSLRIKFSVDKLL